MTSADASTVATVVLAVVAASALAVNVWQMRLTHRSLDAVQESIREARRARLDALAPSVVVGTVTQPAWPTAEAQPVVTNARNPLLAGTRYDLPGHKDKRLLLSTYVSLTNESETSALITLPVGGIPVDDKSARPPDAGEPILKWFREQRLSHQLGPHESQWFLLERGHTVARWAELWEIFEGRIDADVVADSEVVPGVRFRIDVRGQLLRTVQDQIVIDVLGFPIAPLSGATDSWEAQTFVRTTLDQVARTVLVGTLRLYQ